MNAKIIVDSSTMQRTIARLSHEIIEQTSSETEVYLVGIKRRGVPLANAMKEYIEKFSDLKVTSGELDITFYRDDLSERFPDPELTGTSIPFDVNGKEIVLIDDVLYTGRTARAAMEALISLGRPSKIKLCVMVDRGHRELPISANFVGKNIPTSRNEFVAVKVPEYDGEYAVILEDSRRSERTSG